MAETVMTRGEQMTSYGFYLPIGAVIVGFITFGYRQQPGVALTVFVISEAMLAAGLVAALYGLSLMTPRDRPTVLPRGVGGLALNLALALVLVLLTLPEVKAAGLRQQMPGHWTIQQTVNGAPEQVDITLKKDATFDYDVNGAPVMQGHWVLTGYRQVLGITIDHVLKGDPRAEGNNVGLGIVTAVNGQQMVLQTSRGDQIYQRVP